MPAPRSRRRTRLSALVSVALAFTGFQVFLAPTAQAASSTVVISEIFGANGTSNLYNQDFVELHNIGSSTVSLSGMSVQYRSATSGTGASSLVALSGSMPAGGYYLVGGALATPGGTSIPTADASNNSMNLAGAAGVVILANTTTLLTNAQIGAGPSIVGTPTSNALIQDLVGYGATPDRYETGRAPAPSNTTVIKRTAADGDNNTAEFASSATGDPTPSAPAALALATISPKTGSVDTAITSFSLSATGGTTPYTYSATGLPDGVTVNPTSGLVSGTPTESGTFNVVAKVVDSASTPAEQTQPFTFTVTALSVTNPGNKSFTKDEEITPFSIDVSGGTPPYTYAVTTGSLPAGLALDPSSGEISGTPTATQTATSVTITVTDQDSFTATTTFSITVAAVLGIADIQGSGARSTYAGAGTAQGADTLTTKGVITALYSRGFTNGVPGTGGIETCGFCGFYIQTGGSGGDPDATPDAADGIFVFAGSSFAGRDKDGTDLVVGDSVRVSGKVSEFSATGDTASLTELNATAANIAKIAALGPVTAQITLPATYADREAHEGELFKPTDLVITDTFNFEGFGEFGLAKDKPLVQPTELCADDDASCIADAQADIKDNGWFVEDGSSTTFSSGANFFRPKNSANSDIPLPYIDKTHSARVGASVSYPAGGVLDYRNKKWYVQVPRPVLSTHNGAPDLGTDVLLIEDTRPANAAPVDVGGDLKIATYNVENYFSITGEAFAAANPYYASSGPGCEWDYDRNDVPILDFQCTSPQGIPDQWDPVTHAPTHYKSGLVSAPRGAATQASLDRQTAKIVTAISGLGADVVSLEELGNPNKLRMGVTNGPLTPDPDKADGGLGTPIAWRDASISYLVDALNDDAGAATWSFVASPEESTDATSVVHRCSTVQPNGQPVDGPAETAGTCSWASGQDVIRSGFLYKKLSVVPVGPSDLDLAGSSAPTPSPFDNAREPLAQFFKPVGHPNSDGFAVIVNHFKSKGDSDPDATGDNANSDLVGAFNGDRTKQAKELLRFANEFAAKWDTTKVFLVGDFNAYTHEDPVQAILNDPLNTLGFDVVTSDDEDDLTYVFTATVDGVGYGGAGSLDHVFASADAQAMITGTDVWEINSNEPGAYNYSRYNTNKTDFWDGTVPFAGSDHNPEIIGIDVGGAPSVRDIQIIGSNDFHGRLLGSSSDGGAAQLAGAVNSLRSTWGADNTTFVAAGDLIGASTFESFVQKDKPTLEALNAAGLEVSAVGNHEFDQGYHDLIDRVMKPYDATTNPDGIPGGIDWQYIGANVLYDGDPDGAGPLQDGAPIVMPTAVKDFGDGIKIGFVGAVTEDLPALVNPAGMNGVEVTPIAAAVNNYAAQLKTDGADLVVLLVHEGAPSTDCSTMTTGDSAFAELLGDINPDIDAVISGHTHLEYSCSFPVAAWAGNAIKERPVVSAGQYGVALDQLVYSFDTTTGLPVAVTSNNVGVKGPGSTLFSYPEDPVVKQIVDDAVAAAAVPGAVVLGQIDAAFKRARLAGGVTENRGGESTLGNLVAEIQRWATPEAAGIDGAQIAFMNPGGLRDDLNGTGDDFPKDVTYKQAAAVQPFANTLVNMDLTGAQIRSVLEQQWQRDAGGNVPSRPFLRLGSSEGFTYSYYETSDPAHVGANLGHVTGMYLNGVPLSDSATYSVTMNSFLASGGDNFRAFTQGVDERDTGITDLQAQVDYMAANAAGAPLEVDYSQHAVSVTFPPGAPAQYAPGATVAFDLASLAMTAPGDLQDADVKVMLDGQELGTYPVTNTASSQPNDLAGTASVSFALPAGIPDGPAQLHVVGATTGTDVIVPIAIEDGLPDPTVSADDVAVPFGQAVDVEITVDPADADGTVTVLDGDTVLGAPATLTGGTATVTIPANQTGAIGDHELTLSYSGESGVYSASTGSFTLTVGKAESTVAAPNVGATYGQPVPVAVTVTGLGATPSGSVELFDGATSLGTATLLADGTATITVPATTLPVGSKSLTVVYSGDATHLGSQTTLTVTTVKAASSVNAPDVNTTAGGHGTVTVTVTAAGVTPTGTVTLKNGSTEIASGLLIGGSASFNLPVVPDGTVLTADYSGDGNITPGSDTFIVHVGKATPTVVAHDVSVEYGDAATVTVDVQAPNGLTPTGTVTLRNGGTTLGTGTVSGGKATISLPARSLLPGSATLTAEYGGDASLGAGIDSLTATVSKASSTVKADVEPDHPTKKQKVKLSVKVKADNGVEATGKVKIKVDGDTVTFVLDEDGKLKWNLGKFGKGQHKVKVIYLGSSTVEEAEDTVTFRVS